MLNECNDEAFYMHAKYFIYIFKNLLGIYFHIASADS